MSFTMERIDLGGSTRWSLPLPAPITGRPIRCRDVLLVHTGRSGIRERSLQGVDVEKGTVLWSAPSRHDGHRCTPVGGETKFIETCLSIAPGDVKTHLIFRETRTGKALWEIARRGYIAHGPVRVLRHVEVHPHEDPLALQVQVFDGQLVHRRPIQCNSKAGLERDPPEPGRSRYAIFRNRSTQRFE